MLNSKKWMITGGAGYIGAHIADLLISAGKEVLIYDSLYRGLSSRVNYLENRHKKRIPFVISDIRNTEVFSRTIDEFQPDGVIHAAALKSVAESMENPKEYFEVNYHATSNILEILLAKDVHNFIFSSSAAVYGSPPHSLPVDEEQPTNPISPYGSSKLAAEGSVNDFLSKPGKRGTSLRFFNVVGTAAPELIDNSTENLVPIVVNKIRQGLPPVVFGTNYETSDGTCVRDYVDVRDVAMAHLSLIHSASPLPIALNIGSGTGGSVRQIIDLIKKHMGREDIEVIEAARRLGDSAFLCANVELANAYLKSSTRISLENSIESIF
jgi:UDP-glucose 4-epimerase